MEQIESDIPLPSDYELIHEAERTEFAMRALLRNLNTGVYVCEWCALDEPNTSDLVSAHARELARVEHASFCPVLQAGITDGDRYFYITEAPSSPSMKEYVESEVQFHPSLPLRILLNVVEAEKHMDEYGLRVQRPPWTAETVRVSSMGGIQLPIDHWSPAPMPGVLNGVSFADYYPLVQNLLDVTATEHPSSGACVELLNELLGFSQDRDWHQIGQKIKARLREFG